MLFGLFLTLGAAVLSIALRSFQNSYAQKAGALGILATTFLGIYFVTGNWALGLVAADVGICLVPSSVRNLGRADVVYLDLEEPKIMSPIIMSHRKNDRSPLLAQLVKLVREFDDWEAPAGPQPAC